MKRSFCVLSSGFGLALAISPHLSISRLIGQPLANDAADGLDGPLKVLDAEGAAMIIPEIELREIAVKMVPSAMLIDSLHTTLEDREIALDGVGVDIAAPVLATIVVHQNSDSNLFLNLRAGGSASDRCWASFGRTPEHRKYRAGSGPWPSSGRLRERA